MGPTIGARDRPNIFSLVSTLIAVGTEISLFLSHGCFLPSDCDLDRALAGRLPRAYPYPEASHSEIPFYCPGMQGDEFVFSDEEQTVR